MTTAGIKALRKVQLGRESTAGDAVAATTIWRGPAIMPVAVSYTHLTLPTIYSV